jgi:hypothetical protein
MGVDKFHDKFSPAGLLFLRVRFSRVRRPVSIETY